MALNSIYDVGLGATFKRLNALKFPNAESRIRKSMEAPESAKTITVFVNGDSNYSGKKFVVNRKRTPTFDTLLGDVTTGVKAPFGAVRNLYTPVGGTRVLDLADLLTGKTYVASGGARTKFQKIEYGAKPRPRRARSQDPRGKTRDEKALNPVVAQSRFHEFRDLNQKNVIVYANGNSRTPYKFLLKSPRSQNLDHILDDVAIKISKKTGAAIRHMYTTEGKKILNASQVEDGGTYVACGNEKFKQMAYGTNTAPPSIDRQPRARHVPPRLKPVRVVSKDRKPKKSKESENKINKTAKVSRPLPPLEQNHGDAMEIEDDKNTKVEVPIEQRESEEIENNEAEDAEGLNEEIKKNDEVESVGNEEVTEEISAEAKPEDKPEGKSEDEPAEEIAEESAETENKETNETQDLETNNNTDLDQTDIKEESNDVESNDKIEDETNEELDAEKADSPPEDVSGSTEKQEIEYNEVEQKAEEQAEVKQAIETAVTSLNSADNVQAADEPVEETTEEPTEKLTEEKAEELQTPNEEGSPVDEKAEAEPETVVQQTEDAEGDREGDPEETEVTVDDSELNTNDNNINETEQPKADILVIETPDVVETSDNEASEEPEVTTEVKDEAVVEANTEEAVTEDKAASDVEDAGEEPQTPKSDISIAVSVKNEDTEVEISVKVEENKENTENIQPSEEAAEPASTEAPAETLADNATKEETVEAQEEVTEDAAKDTSNEPENVTEDKTPAETSDNTPPEVPEEQSEVEKSEVDPLGEGQTTVNTTESDATSHPVQETTDKEPIVEEPEVSVDQPSSPPKTPNLPIQSSDEFEETKPETEPTTDAGLSDAFVTEKAAQRSKSPSGDN